MLRTLPTTKNRRCRRSESNPRPNQDGGARARRGARAPRAAAFARTGTRRDLAQVLFWVPTWRSIMLRSLAIARLRASCVPRAMQRATRATERKNTHAPATREGRRSKRPRKGAVPDPSGSRRRPAREARVRVSLTVEELSGAVRYSSSSLSGPRARRTMSEILSALRRKVHLRAASGRWGRRGNGKGKDVGKLVGADDDDGRWARTTGTERAKMSEIRRHATAEVGRAVAWASAQAPGYGVGTDVGTGVGLGVGTRHAHRYRRRYGRRPGTSVRASVRTSTAMTASPWALRLARPWAWTSAMWAVPWEERRERRGQRCRRSRVGMPAGAALAVGAGVVGSGVGAGLIAAQRVGYGSTISSPLVEQMYTNSSARASYSLELP